MSVIDDYLKKVPEPQRQALQHVREIVKKAAPDAEEVISYGMPGFRYQGKYLFGFAPFKDHLSLFPTSNPIAILKQKLGAYKLDKGTIRFTPDKPVPEALITELVKVRLQAIKQSALK